MLQVIRFTVQRTAAAPARHPTRRALLGMTTTRCYDLVALETAATEAHARATAMRRTLRAWTEASTTPELRQAQIAAGVAWFAFTTVETATSRFERGIFTEEQALAWIEEEHAIAAKRRAGLLA